MLQLNVLPVKPNWINKDIFNVTPKPLPKKILPFLHPSTCPIFPNLSKLLTKLQRISLMPKLPTFWNNFMAKALNGALPLMSMSQILENHALL